MIDVTESPGGTPPPVYTAVGNCATSTPCNSFGCSMGSQTGFDPTSWNVWGPTDITIVYKGDEFQAFITDSRNGCVLRVSGPHGEPYLQPYQPSVFGVCGANRKTSFVPVTVAADASSSGALPAVYVGHRVSNKIYWHDGRDEDAMSGNYLLDAK
jgi:hypothetical protein